MPSFNEMPWQQARQKRLLRLGCSSRGRGCEGGTEGRGQKSRLFYFKKQVHGAWEGHAVSWRAWDHTPHLPHPPILQTTAQPLSFSASIHTHKKKKKTHRKKQIFGSSSPACPSAHLPAGAPRSRWVSLIARQAIDLIHIVMFIRGNFKTARPRTMTERR